MKIKRKWALGIGLAAMFIGVFWMRALASWRPVTIARVGFSLEEIRVSRDGQWALVKNNPNSRGAVVNLRNGDYDSTSGPIRAFDKEHGAETFPRVWMRESDLKPYFSSAPQRNVFLSGLAPTSAASCFYDGELRFPTAWSKPRGEVYCAIQGVIWICDWTTGKLKKRVRYAKRAGENTVFSPDGKWLLAVEQTPYAITKLRRYDVQSGKADLVDQAAEFSSIGWSPDGKLFWFVRSGTLGLNVERATDSKLLWSAASAGPVKWLPEGRVGIVGERGFEWRDFQGHLISRLPGPLSGVVSAFQSSNQIIHDWAPSPDGNWIYSCHSDGTIHRWRMR